MVSSSNQDKSRIARFILEMFSAKLFRLLNIELYKIKSSVVKINSLQSISTQKSQSIKLEILLSLLQLIVHQCTAVFRDWSKVKSWLLMCLDPCVSVKDFPSSSTLSRPMSLLIVGEIEHSLTFNTSIVNTMVCYWSRFVYSFELVCRVMLLALEKERLLFDIFFDLSSITFSTISEHTMLNSTSRSK